MPHNTLEMYDEFADELSDRYDQIGPRYGDIALAFAEAGNPENAVVLEIGCGNGRDAQAIKERTPYYTGIDTSEKMLVKAQDRLPDTRFEKADAITYEFPTETLDIVFAFAPFRHMDIDEVTTVLRKIYDSLRVGGVLYLSSNFGPKYEEGERPNQRINRIYYYNPAVIQKHAPHGFKKASEQQDTVNGEPWFELSLRKEF